MFRRPCLAIAHLSTLARRVPTAPSCVLASPAAPVGAEPAPPCTAYPSPRGRRVLRPGRGFRPGMAVDVLST